MYDDISFWIMYFVLILQIPHHVMSGIIKFVPTVALITSKYFLVKSHFLETQNNKINIVLSSFTL